jgi:hypothetical protein
VRWYLIVSVALFLIFSCLCGIDTCGWQWVFYINLIPGALMICAIIFAVRSTPMQLGRLRDGDWLGIGCMAVGLGSLIAMLEEGQRDDWFGSVFIQRCALLAAVFIPAFVIMIKDIVRRDAYIMAFDDAFLIVGISLLIGAVLVWFCRKTKAKEGMMAH